jgi:hypothetical protein
MRKLTASNKMEKQELYTSMGLGYVSELRATSGLLFIPQVMYDVVMWGGKFSIENFPVRKIFQKIFRNIFPENFPFLKIIT